MGNFARSACKFLAPAMRSNQVTGDPMARQALHALNVFEGLEASQDSSRVGMSERPGPRIFTRQRKSALPWLALVAFIVCVGVRQGAQANTLPSSAPAQLAASDAGEPALGDLVLSVLPAPARWLPAPARCQRDQHAPPSWELRALEPDDIEDDAQLDAFVASSAPQLAAIASFADRRYALSSQASMAQVLLSFALPRGPPASIR
jgi:hypothetical protein